MVEEIDSSQVDSGKRLLGWYLKTENFEDKYCSPL
jgi:hypothetical protein